MSFTRNFYELSKEADYDIEDILAYTEEEFGVDQAEKYIFELAEVFESLLLNTHLGKSRNEIRKGLRSIPKGEHIVFYQVMIDRIKIIRVLHTSRDVPKIFGAK